MNNKGKNTTIVAYVGLIMSIVILGSFVLGKIDMQQMLGAFGGIGTLIGVFVGFLAKDQNKSHTIDTRADTTNPTKPGGGKT
jgi:hypothetical protein